MDFIGIVLIAILGDIAINVLWKENVDAMDDSKINYIILLYSFESIFSYICIAQNYNFII